jgi:protein phosphatase
MWESSDNTHNANSTITTHTLPVGSVTTTIQAPRHADLENADPFADNEIERAIDEIRSALDKSSKLTNK